MDSNSEQGQIMSDHIICCDDVDDDRQSDDDQHYKLADSRDSDEFADLTTNQVMCHSAQGRRGLVHSVSIIVEPAINVDECNFGDELQIQASAPTERRKTIAGPVVLLEDFYFDQPKKAKEYDDIVQSLFASARLRKEEFARLLEEHAEIVSEINKAEINLL